MQEQQTGFSTQFDDQHEFYVCTDDSPPKKSSRISLQHVEIDLLHPLWRTSTARPNVQHGAGATNGIFIPIRRYIRVLCVHAQLSAKEEQQNIAATRETRPIPRLTPLKFPRRNGQKIKKSEMQVTALEADSDPAEADLFIHVLNALTCPLDQKLRAFKMHTKV